MNNFNTPMHQRRLHRSNTDRFVGGVLGGIAETYGVTSRSVVYL